MFIIHFKRAGQLNIEALFVGPFMSHGAAYDALCAMPAPVALPEDEDQAEASPGFKYIEELTTPQDAPRN